MKATVREYTVKKKLIVVEVPIEDVQSILRVGVLTEHRQAEILGAFRDALESDRASDAKEDESDIPF